MAEIAREAGITEPILYRHFGSKRDLYLACLDEAVLRLPEFDDPDDLQIGCTVNGRQMQLARTSELIFSVPELVSRLSAIITLFPGDVIFTGTPAGVGHARTPPEYLHPGDRLDSTIEGIGTLRNSCVAP